MIRSRMASLMGPQEHTDRRQLCHDGLNPLPVYTDWFIISTARPLRGVDDLAASLKPRAGVLQTCKG